MTEQDLVEFLKARMRVELDISEGFDPYGRGPFNAQVKISLKGEADDDDVLLCESRTSFSVSE